MSEVLDHNPNLSFVYSDHYRVDEKSIKQKIVRINNMNKLFLHGAGIMFRKKDIIEVGNYNKKLREAEDHELIKRLLLKKKNHTIYQCHYIGTIFIIIIYQNLEKEKKLLKIFNEKTNKNWR